MSENLQRASRQLKKWCLEKALPLWAERAHLPDGSWVEHLTRDGQPDKEAERRWRILARQVYVYAESTRLGWFDGETIARQTYIKMRETGYVQRVTPEGNPTERRRDFYDHAFYLLASASLYRLTSESEYLNEANALLASLEADFRHDQGGWKETPRGLLPRRQNPHMHLFEACLYLHIKTQDPYHLEFTHRIHELFKSYFFNPQKKRICEYFNDDWSVLKGNTGRSTEPGHSMEWVWLLALYEKTTGIDTSTVSLSLYENTLSEREDFLNDEEDMDGKIRRDTKRLWVQTELIKAHLAMAERGLTGAAECAAGIIDGLFASYLNSDGTWNDQLDASGRNIAKTIPVSTFYHILCMATEAERISALLED